MVSLSTGQFKLSVFFCYLVTSASYGSLTYFTENQPPAAVTACGARPQEDQPHRSALLKTEGNEGNVPQQKQESRRAGNRGCLEVAGPHPEHYQKPGTPIHCQPGSLTLVGFLPKLSPPALFSRLAWIPFTLLAGLCPSCLYSKAVKVLPQK